MTTCHARRRERWVGVGLTCAAGVLAIGCGSPPSVLPLLDAAERAVRLEADRLDADAHREREWIEQTRQSLERAYERDLDERAERHDGGVEVEWVRTATRAYTAAREELLRHELDQRQQRARRRENLELAGDALDRAARILRQQDELIARAVGGRAWNLLSRERDE